MLLSTHSSPQEPGEPWQGGHFPSPLAAQPRHRQSAFSRRMLINIAAESIPCVGGAGRTALCTLVVELASQGACIPLAPQHPAMSRARARRKTYRRREWRPVRGVSGEWLSWANRERVWFIQADDSSPPNPPILSPGPAEARMGGDTNRWGGRAARLRWSAIAGSPAESCVPPHVGDVSPRPGWCLDTRHQIRHRSSFDLPEDAHAMRHATCRRCHSWGNTFACMRRVVDDQTARPCPPRQPVRRQLSLRQAFPGWSELLPGLFVCLRPVTGSTCSALCKSGSGIGGDLNPTGIGLGRRPETVFHSLRSRGMPL